MDMAATEVDMVVTTEEEDMVVTAAMEEEDTAATGKLGQRGLCKPPLHKSYPR